MKNNLTAEQIIKQTEDVLESVFLRVALHEPYYTDLRKLQKAIYDYHSSTPVEPVQDEKTTKVAVKLSEHLDAKEQAMFVAGFQECIKWNKNMLNEFDAVKEGEEDGNPHLGINSSTPYMSKEGELRSEIVRLKQQLAAKEDKGLLDELNQRLEDGRNYLMSIEANKVVIADALEAFGFGRSGLDL